MREYERAPEAKLMRVVCNGCGRVLRVENGLLKEACFHGDMEFGYFSSRDGARHRFDLCEDCYNKLTAKFVVPVEENLETEML